MARSSRGFTLVEMLVVIAVIVILVAFLAVWIVGTAERGMYVKAHAIVKMLDQGCRTYKKDFGVYPPNDKGDSRCLHFYLGRERWIETHKPDQGPAIRVKRPPILEFPADMLAQETGVPDPNKPSPVVDPWRNPIRYLNPGRYNKTFVDLWSAGKNGTDELNPESPDFDDVTNWSKDF